MTITRGLDQSQQFTKWIKETLDKGAVATARQNSRSMSRTTEGNTVAAIQLMNGWASKWEGPALKAGESPAATEKVTITFEEIEVE